MLVPQHFFLFKYAQELDPPPWLNRMREMGYPPGYLGKYVIFLNLPTEYSLFVYQSVAVLVHVQVKRFNCVLD